MRLMVVGISDCKVSADPRTALITYALGSCIGIALHDAQAQVSGLLHILLPDSQMDKEKARANPWTYADTGIPLLLASMRQQGARTAGMRVAVIGGAQVIQGHQMFEIGRRNYLAVRKALWKAGMLTELEAVGGAVARTVRIEVAAGEVWVKEGRSAERLLLRPVKARAVFAGKES
jgi:chemotaxis protein CheD